jgi:hypothetical protein
MKGRLRLLLCLVLVPLAACTSAEAGAYDCDELLRRADGKVFELFLGAKQGSDSDLAEVCLKRLPVVKRVRFREPGAAKELVTVSEATARSAVSAEAGEPLVVINIEEWKTKGPDALVAENVKKLTDVLKAAQAELPDTKIGIYSMVPSRDYFRAVGDRGPEAFTQWQSENTRLTPLAQQADALFPSVYTFKKESPDRWTRYAHANVLEAKRLAPQKPIYPFIWNRYHKSKEPIEAAFLQAQFDALFQMEEATGAVVWLGSKEPWDTSSTWIVALKGFLDERAQAGTVQP